MISRKRERMSIVQRQINRTTTQPARQPQPGNLGTQRGSPLAVLGPITSTQLRHARTPNAETSHPPGQTKSGHKCSAGSNVATPTPSLSTRTTPTRRRRLRSHINPTHPTRPPNPMGPDRTQRNPGTQRPRRQLRQPLQRRSLRYPLKTTIINHAAPRSTPDAAARALARTRAHSSSPILTEQRGISHTTTRGPRANTGGISTSDATPHSGQATNRTRRTGSSTGQRAATRDVTRPTSTHISPAHACPTHHSKRGRHHSTNSRA